LVSAGCAVLLVATTTGITAAETPTPGRGALVTLDEANGFVAVGELVTAHGAVVATFRSETATVAVIGGRGSAVSFQPTAPAAGRPGTLQLSMSAKRPKTAKDATAYRDSGRTLIGDLVALGMPRDEAERQFGDLATLDGNGNGNGNGSGSGNADGDGSAVTSRQLLTVASAPQAAPAASGTPYDTQCASIKVAGGKITGYGCSTFFLVHQSGSDWWLMTKMKVSAHSNDESWFSPKRLTQLGWRITWAAGNVLHDWDPYSTQPVGTCVTLTVKSSSPWADVSVQGNVCPNSLGPWAVTTARSGGIWNGMERGTDYEGALATQAVHSPPGAAAAYQSAWTLSYCDMWCN
jgi:hypothetical protein